jgi:FkbM family methyltransferase
MPSIAQTIRRAVRHFGFDITRFDPAYHVIARRQHLLRHYQVDLVLDVGANTGQYAGTLRNDVRYAGRIVSFEPVSSAYKTLSQAAADDSLWEVNNCALGDVAGIVEINVAGNSQSSSLLGMLPAHLDSAPESQYVGREKIEVKRLDSIFQALAAASKHTYLKVDTQGFERNVIDGARSVLNRIGTIQLELSLVPLYQGEMLFAQMHEFMREAGYRLVALEPTFTDRRSGELLQVDGIFRRTDLAT